MKLVFMAFIALSLTAAVPSSVCNLPTPPNDVSPALAACLNTYQAVELAGFYQANTTLTIPQGTTLTSKGSFNAAITAGPNLTGPVIKLDSNVSSTVEGIQIQLPNASTVAGGILITNTTWNAQYNMVRRNYLEDGSNGTKSRYGIKLLSTGPYQIAYNDVENNVVFQFFIAIHTVSMNGSTYPVTANHFKANRTSGVFNLMLDSGTQQSTFAAHFCNGWANVPSAPTCLTMGNPLVGSVHENLVEVHSDITGQFAYQGKSYNLYANAQKNVIVMFSSDGNGTPAAPTTGLPAVIGTNNTTTY